MRRRASLAALAMLLVMAVAPVAARAQGEGGGVGLLSRLHYGALGGLLVPVGPQGRSLSRGPYAGFTVVGESVIGMQLGGELGFASSDDYLRTRFVSLGALARLSPTPDDYRVFVQLGTGLYRVTYSPKLAGTTAPKSTTRPGGSFGLGLDLFQSNRIVVGGLLTYHGVVLASSSARSYVIAALNVTLRPSDY